MVFLNKVLLIGNLTRDPAQKFIPNGKGVVEFGIAMNERFTVNGEKREVTCFVDCAAWDKTGESMLQYFHKGDPIFVEGKLKLDQWEKNGEKRSRLSVTVDRWQFVGSKGGGGSTEPPAEKHQQQTITNPDTDSLPF